MNNQNMSDDACRYLKRFDEILYEMSYKMLSQNITNSITTNFIECMIPHHQAAIYMCENLLKYTNYPPLIKIATDIIQTQTKGIEEMKEVLKTSKNYTNSKVNVRWYMNKYFRITKHMINRMKNSLRTKNINLNFTSEMIPHHEGAIQMCNNLLQYSIDPKLKAIAENIISQQSQGVIELKKIQSNLKNMTK